MILIPLNYTGTFMYFRKYHTYYHLQFTFLKSLLKGWSIIFLHFKYA